MLRVPPGHSLLKPHQGWEMSSRELLFMLLHVFVLVCRSAGDVHDPSVELEWRQLCGLVADEGAAPATFKGGYFALSSCKLQCQADPTCNSISYAGSHCAPKDACHNSASIISRSSGCSGCGCNGGYSTYYFDECTNDEVTVGTGTTEGDVPINMFYSYSYSQQLYLQSDIGVAGDITSVSFQYNGQEHAFSESILVYMGHSSKQSFASRGDWVPFSDESR